MSVLLRSTERVFQAFQGCSETGPADCHFLPQLVEIKMNKRQLSRRHFTLCAAVGLSLPIVPAASVVAADAPPRTVKLRNAAIVPAIGQGSARLGQGRHPETAEQEALRTGISLGMSLIDTSGNYGNGRSEKLIGRAIAGQRDSVFLVSKVEADEVSGDRMTRACEASLSRLGAKLSRSLFVALASAKFPILRRGSGFRTTTRGGENQSVGRLQLQYRSNGSSLPHSRGQSLCHQSGSLQPQQPRY